MKTLLRNLIFYTTFIYTFAPALADHTNPNHPLDRLVMDTDRLEYQVWYSNLRYEVKSAVRNFAYDVDYFARCMDMYPQNPLYPNHSVCRFEFDRVRYSFYSVDRYLYDTYYDYPQIYNSYRRVKDDLRYFQ